MANKLTIALIQMRCAPEREANVQTALALLEQAAAQGAEVACLPELFASEYFCQREDPALFDLAEPVPGPTTEALAAFAREKNMVVIGSVFERRAPGIYHNTAVVLERNGTLKGLYRKMHIPHDPLFYEKYYFTPGDTGFQTFGTSAGSIGTLVCWDQWYPEGARLTAMQGADILFYPTAIGWHPSEKAQWAEAQLDAWVTIQRSHAIANGVYVAACNRIGHEKLSGDGLEFWGHSFVADPYGRIIARASADKEEVLLAEIDPAMIEEKRRNWPFFRDRRIDAYGGLTQRWTGSEK
ncbi:MAG: carbon-nitrogen hydrolase [Alphaproteobacteria bacterium]|nr:carbon-nitrogen hydrolase [Alphaproteobacteria bacterium]